MNKKYIYLLGIFFITLFLVGCGDDETLDNIEPMGSDPFTFTVSESISDAEEIGTLMAEDAFRNLVFSIEVNDNDLFEVTEDGILSLASGKSLDYETATSHSIVVGVTDRNQTGSYVVTINVTDDTADNIMASFAVTSIEEFELTESSEIVINLSEPVLTEGYTVTVNIDPGTSVYSVDYTTIPDGTTGTFEVPIELGQSSASFTVDIVNDLEEEGDETLSFTLTNGANDLIVPADTDNTLDFTVIDDDQVELYLYVGQGGSEDPTGLYTVNPKSGAQVLLTEITLDGGLFAFPGQIEWNSSALELYVTSFGATLYSVDITTGEAILEVDFWTDYADQFAPLTNPPAITGTYLDGNTIYLTMSGQDVATFTTYNFLANVDMSTGTVSVMQVDFSSVSTGVAGLGLINDEVHIILQFLEDSGDGTGVYPVAFDVSNGTVGDEFAITYSPDLESATGHIAGVNTMVSADLVNNTFITNGRLEELAYDIMEIDPATGVISHITALETVDSQRGLSIIPTADLQALGF